MLLSAQLYSRTSTKVKQDKSPKYIPCFDCMTQEEEEAGGGDGTGIEGLR